MAFKQRDMKILVTSYSKIWNYWTEDSAISICNRGYFDEFSSNFGVGDWIYATTCTGGVILHVDEIDPLEMSKPK